MEGENNPGAGVPGADNGGANPGAGAEAGQGAGVPGADNPGINNGGANPGAGQGAGTEKVVPEEYEFHVAEGLTIDDNMKQEFTAVAKELKLSQAEADKLVELHGNILMGMMKEHDAELEDWSNKCHEQGLDKEELLADANYALKMLGGGEAAKVLEETGAIYHPAVLKMLQFVGGAIREDKGTDGRSGANGGVKISDLIFAASKK